VSTVKFVLGGIAVAMVIALLAWPVKEVCPNGPCTTAPDADGHVHRYYEVEPLGAIVLETITGKSLPLRYSTGEEKAEKVRSADRCNSHRRYRYATTKIGSRPA
jgi:hypothetical protein